ncbi:TPA: phage portal protein [Streptococcus suis]|nr:phage portal protein [Streptococcus suis]HEM6295111.1 phage portal protein [Streptococcus suis]HEM6418850.1 phage portal protein [Streptococcus suis]HEM6424715.1 phage portal protein [Streptococcus suis]
MFRNLWTKIKGVMQKMGLIKGLKDLSLHREIELSDKHYDSIQVWKELYQGYHDKIHDYYEKSILDGRKKKKRLTLNIPKVVTSELATLIFNEKCEINVGSKNESLTTLINETLEKNNFTQEFQRFLEYSFALGGMAIKAYLKKDGNIGLNFVQADSFIPISWDNAGISEAVFVDTQYRGKYKYTHLEWHTWEGELYVVAHELFRTDKSNDDVGIRVPITEIYPDLKSRVVIEKLSRPLFVYLKPNSANNIDLSSPLGISIYHSAFDTLRAIDIAYDSFEREFRLGRKRILVPTSAIRTVVDNEGNFQRYFDATDETYEAFHTGEDSRIQDIKDISVELRVDEHIAAINALLNLLSMQIGFSPGSFSFDGASGVKTATEVISENSKTFRTKQSHETMVEAALKNLVAIIVDFGDLYGLIKGESKYDVTVTFDDSIAQDRTQDAQYYIALVGAGLISKKKAIMKLFKLSEKDATSEIEAIREESQTPSDTAVDLFGLGGDA